MSTMKVMMVGTTASAHTVDANPTAGRDRWSPRRREAGFD
ncbi:hypothetical protein JOF47_001318 [Paeniglutamicibacter kerguelensis]|uniref:Uncharacterized protein n=1 Tax=Paeniglutamicibacter kerguelensis TaxID=254788 RepID=A0ABS4XBG3_9MICC|nr:hypothetical protein [Paeniglutamicibacter kerguelensis]